MHEPLAPQPTIRGLVTELVSAKQYEEAIRNVASRRSENRDASWELTMNLKLRGTIVCEFAVEFGAPHDCPPPALNRLIEAYSVQLPR